MNATVLYITGQSGSELGKVSSWILDEKQIFR